MRKEESKHMQAVSFNDFMHEDGDDLNEIDNMDMEEECIENPLQKRSIRDMFEQEVFAGSKSGEDVNSGMSLAQSSLMILGNKFKNNKHLKVG